MKTAPAMKRTLTLLTALLLAPLAAPHAADAKITLFDMDAIRDPKTLAIEVLRDWHVVEGAIHTRQKLVTINVGEIWPGQDYRIPVKMIVPADRKAKGFHLTGGHSPDRLEKTLPVNPLELALIKGGVGLVYTVVQDPGSYGQHELGGASEARFAKSLNPRYKIQYWAWPATLMRAVTTAYAESEHFGAGQGGHVGRIEERCVSFDGDSARRTHDGGACGGVADLGFAPAAL